MAGVGLIVNSKKKKILTPKKLVAMTHKRLQSVLVKTTKPKCTKCGDKMHPLAVFPGGICLACHAKKFDAEVARNGGILPRPDFRRVIAK